MLGLSWDQIILIVLAALFLLGPERIPTAMKWIVDGLRKVRTFAAGAQSEMRSQFGSELDELRRQISELQSLKELKELRELRDLDPRRMVGKSLLGDEFSGGVKGFLGLSGDGPAEASDAATAPPAPDPAGPSVGTASTIAAAAPVASPADDPGESQPLGEAGPSQGSPPAPRLTNNPGPAAASPWADAT